MARFLRNTLPLLFAALILPALSAPARACPFCSMQGQTLAGEVAGADMVLFGTLENANAKDETTDLVLDSVLKKNDLVAGKKVVTLPKYVPPDAAGQYKFLVFCYVFKGKIDPYRGMAMKPDSDIVAYLKGVQELKDKKAGERLRFFFDYLDNVDAEISMDAFKEFANADYKDYRDMAKDLPADKLAGWLRDRNTPGFRVGLYGSLLGHCGKEEHAKLLRSLLEDPERKLSSGVDGVLAGYTMINPPEGWKYTRGLMADPGKEFLLRYAGLRAARFLHDFRPDLVSRKDLADGVAQLLEQKDIADLAVEDLRKWNCSDMTDRVLALQAGEAYKTLPIVRRAVLRFALSFPDTAADVAYVNEERKTNAQGVSEAEEILKLEQGEMTGARDAAALCELIEETRMVHRTLMLLPLLGLLLALVPRPAPACSLCGGALQQAPTLRQEAAQPGARLILFGPIQNPRGAVTTILTVESALRSDPVLGGKKTLDLGRYLPVSDARNPPRFLFFCDVVNDKVDPYRGVPIRSAEGLDYARKALALDPKDPAGNLDFYFNYLENPDKEIAFDAFLEFVRATDRQLGQAAPKLSPDRLRGWLKDPQTPPERLSLYAFLLGGCGGAADADFLEAQLGDDGDRVVNAYDGYLGGYLRLRPREGWEKVIGVLRDGRKPLPVRLAAVRTVRMYHGWQPKESRENVLKSEAAVIAQGELADVAVEDLRRWQIWDLTPEILAPYGKKGFDAPIMRRAVVRYALSCDDGAARKFVAERRRYEADLVREVEESLQFEK